MNNAMPEDRLEELQLAYDKLDEKSLADIIERGKILNEIRQLVKRGQFVKWIDEHFDLRRSTAYNYMDAAHFAIIVPTVGNLKLRRGALYLLCEKLQPLMDEDDPDPFDDDGAINAVLNAAKDSWISRKEAARIYDEKRNAAREQGRVAAKARKLGKTVDEVMVDEESEDAAGAPRLDDEIAASQAKLKAREATTDAILDSPRPDLQSSIEKELSKPRRQSDHAKLTAALEVLLELSKSVPPSKFRSNVPGYTAKMAQYLTALAYRKPSSEENTVHVDQSVEATKVEHAINEMSMSELGDAAVTATKQLERMGDRFARLIDKFDNTMPNDAKPLDKMKRVVHAFDQLKAQWEPLPKKFVDKLVAAYPPSKAA